MIEDFIEMMVIFLGGIVALLGLVFLLVCLYNWTVGPSICTAFQDASGLETSYDFWGGCYVTMEDGRTLEKDVARSIWKKDYKLDIN